MYDIQTSTHGIILPHWVADCVSACVRIHGDFSSPESRMDFAILLAKKNVEHQTGGPFGAAIFDMDNHQLISVGVNLVVSSNCSHFHAEMVAIALAQQTLQSYALNSDTLPKCELVSSCEPCAMCFGAIPWSGIVQLSSGATAADAEAIGFDEGPKHPDWIAELQKRGIQVFTEVQREKAAAVLQAYQGQIYNGRA